MKTAAMLFLLFCCSPVFSQTAREQPAQARALFDSFHKSLDEIRGRFVKNTAPSIPKSEIAESIANINDYVNSLESAITSRTPSPKAYLESLALDVELLKRLATQQVTSETEKIQLYDGLKDVEADLKIKANAKRRCGNCSRDPNGEEITFAVQVLVHAKKGGQEVGAYLVWYVPIALKSDSTEFKRFDSLTDPDPNRATSMNLAPGCYQVWLTKDEAETKRQVFSIGLNGEAKREIDVPVP
ncbi:MAG TPA: hypothetical protein VN743_12660 [Blastocatellia bacterium]|nr:hypothetical protein [Blastocatellia bacterium]